jgi:DNA-binding MarR family transcriptional regulator
MMDQAVQSDPGRAGSAQSGRAQAGSAQSGTIVLLTRLARAVFLRSSVDLVGMNLRNMVVLAYLRDHPGVSQQAMTEHLSMDSNTGVLVLNDLEDLEYVERRRDPSDRRRHIVDITEAGLEALERAELAQGSIEDEILGGLSVAERAELRRLLVRALEDHEPQAG